jgi:hypothetical protein
MTRFSSRKHLGIIDIMGSKPPGSIPVVLFLFRCENMVTLTLALGSALSLPYFHRGDAS